MWVPCETQTLLPFQVEIYAELLLQILSLFISFPKFPSSYFICIMENIVAGEDHYPIKIHASTFVSCWMSSNLEALSLCFTCRGTKGSLWAAYHSFKGTVPISTECNKHGLRTCPVELSHVSCDPDQSLILRFAFHFCSWFLPGMANFKHLELSCDPVDLE